MNVEEHEGRRTAAALAGSAVIGVAAVFGIFWVFTAGGPSPVGVSQALVTTPTPGDTTIPAVPTTSVTSIVVPSPTTVPFTPTTVIVAPAELPTMTAPDPGQTTDPGPGPTTPAVVPTTAQPPTVTSPPGVSGVSMFCRKNGDRVEGGLSFTTTTPVSVSLVAGGKVEQRAAAGPGVVTVLAAGKRGSFCLATVGTQRFGPMTAS